MASVARCTALCCWIEEGRVLRRSILWCDGRTQEECDEITQTIGKERLIELSANPVLTGFTAGKILWVRKHEPEVYEKAAHILLPKDYVRYRLTGEYAAEMSDASGTNLLDVSAPLLVGRNSGKAAH